MIEIKHENIEELKKWGLGLEKIMEDCYFCRKETRYWAVKVNKPVCPECAKIHDETELLTCPNKVGIKYNLMGYVLIKKSEYEELTEMAAKYKDLCR